MAPESLVAVCEFPLSEEHRANNLADRLEEAGLTPTLLYDGGSVTMAVPEGESRDALRVSERFLSDYDAELDDFVSRNLKPSLGGRLWILTYTVFIPLLLAWYSLSNLWRALYWNPGSEPYLSTWRAQDLGVGIVGLCVCMGYVVAVFTLRRRIRRTRSSSNSTGGAQ